MKFLKKNKTILKATVITTILLGIIIILSIYLRNFAPRKMTLSGCGTNLPNYKYSIELQGQWIVSKQVQAGQLDKYISSYSLQKDNKKLTISCTTQGVGSDICDNKYRTKFDAGNQNGEACYAQINGVWEMGVLNLPRDLSTNAAIGIWAHNIEPKMLNKMLSTFNILK